VECVKRPRLQPVKVPISPALGTVTQILFLSCFNGCCLRVVKFVSKSVRNRQRDNHMDQQDDRYNAVRTVT